MMQTISKVVLLDKIDPSSKTIFEENGIEALIYQKFSDIPDDILSTLDGLIVRSATNVTSDVIMKCPNLKIVGRAGTGVDNVDTTAATARGIIVMNTPSGNTISAAEHTCAMIISLARFLPRNHMDMKAGKWQKFLGHELLGKTVGIIGLGRIGLEVAKRMQSFGMSTIGYDPIVPASVAAQWGVEWIPLDDLWPQCDYITVHVPLIPSTRNLIGKKTLAQCKKGVKVVNVARGGIINEEELLEALEEGQCGGAALDVFETEPPQDYRVIQHKMVIATSHLGANTTEAQARCGQDIAHQFCDFSKGLRLVGAINAPALVSSLSSANSGWVSLAIALGAVAAGVAGSDVTGDWNITIRGRDTSNVSSFIGTAITVGILKTLLPGNGVNLVNAPSLGLGKGLSVCRAKLVEQESDTNGLLISHSSGIRVSGIVSVGAPLLTNINDTTFIRGALLTGSLAVFQAPLDLALGKISSISESFVGFDLGSGIDSWNVVRYGSSASAKQLVKEISGFAFDLSH